MAGQDRGDVVGVRLGKEVLSRRQMPDLAVARAGEGVVRDATHERLDEPVLAAFRRPRVGLDGDDLLAHERRQHGV